MIQDITEQNRDIYNKVVTHPLQSYEWGEFRQKTGIKVIRKGLFEGSNLKEAFTITIHKIPRTPWTIGYVPKCIQLSNEMLFELQKIGTQHKCIFVQIEPNIIYKTYDPKTGELQKRFDLPGFIKNENIISSAHPLFTNYTFVLDLSKTEGELLQNMHAKTRYNIRVAQKHGVKITVDEQGFETYWRLTEETTKRQGFYAHTKNYHDLMWQTFKEKNEIGLQAFLLTATYRPPEKKDDVNLVSWVLFRFHNTLYYPYGASSSEFRNVMASNLMMWEAIRFGKNLGLTKFDMWGSLGPNPDTSDPWFGFHRLKNGYNPELIEFIGNYDMVINPKLYQVYKLVDKLRWIYLKLKK